MLKRTIVILFILMMRAAAQSITVFPSYYITYGKYSVAKSSVSNAVYTTVGLDYRWFHTIAFDNLSIKESQWKYKQQMFLLGSMFSSYPYNAKAYYAYFPAEFTYMPKLAPGTPSFDYTNVSNLFSFEVNRYIDDFFVGAAFVHMHAIGPINYGKELQSSTQLTLRTEYPLTDELSLAVKPNFFYSERDKRKLFSVGIKAQYQLLQNLTCKAGGMAGVRAYYFDTDLLTVFNQDERQTQNLNAQCDYRFSSQLSFSALYVHSEFDGFQINYYGLGVRGNF